MTLRHEFWLPRRADGSEKVYLLGNSLGPQPRRAESFVMQELSRWRELAADAHSSEPEPWISYHRLLAEPLARLVGAESDEVVAMNSLTVNLHLMLATFYRPQGARQEILMESHPFPSDYHAVLTHLRHRGLDPATALCMISPDGPHGLLSAGRIRDEIRARRDTLALILLPGVHYHTGQWLDIPGITRVAREHEIPIGWDLAHAIGNVPLSLHSWDADFAVWCSYKYLNSGPGAVGGCFVHKRHAARTDLPRLGGWWGHDQRTRFKMEVRFDPMPTIEGWQLSNPPILALAPLRASLELFDRAGGMEPLRQASEQLVAYTEQRLRDALGDVCNLITPGAPGERGSQLSLALNREAHARFRITHGAELVTRLAERGIVTDFREPDVLRFALAPLFNHHEDADALVTAMEAIADG